MRYSSFLFYFIVMGVFAQDFKEKAISLEDDSSLDPLIEAVRDKKLVMLGEASHGTHEYYFWRDRITRRLITEKDFDFIAVEGDFASLYQLNRYIKNKEGAATSAREVLSKLYRWPKWMWANQEVEALAEWLRSYNDALPEEEKIGFYGMDVYDEWESKKEVLRLMNMQSESMFDYVQKEYDCFHPYKGQSWEYAHAVKSGRRDCAHATKNVVDFIRENREEFKNLTPDDYFYLLQNALIVHNAEEFYRESVVSEDPVSWNSRVFHMHATITDLFSMYGKDAKGIVWAHNTHIGDAHYTNMRNSGEKNIGQLSRELLGMDRVFLIGLTSYKGTVMAGSSWGAPMEKMTIPKAIKNSVEHEMNNVGMDSFYVIFDNKDRKKKHLKVIGHRAVGVVYHPKRDRFQFVPTVIPLRYDALLFFSETEALHVLDELKSE